MVKAAKVTKAMIVSMAAVAMKTMKVMKVMTNKFVTAKSKLKKDLCLQVGDDGKAINTSLLKVLDSPVKNSICSEAQGGAGSSTDTEAGPPCKKPCPSNGHAAFLCYHRWALAATVQRRLSC